MSADIKKAIRLAKRIGKADTHEEKRKRVSKWCKAIKKALA